MSRKKIVSAYAKMWPREVFDLREGTRRLALDGVRRMLDKPGVYVLYRDDHPYYVGKTGNRLLKRLYAHANQSQDRYYNFWNFFSAFEVLESDHRDEVEGILIASMPTTANSSNPKFERLRLPAKEARLIAAPRMISVR